MGKLTVKIPASKPRNTVMVAALMRRAGAHDKPYKCLRKSQRQQLQANVHKILRQERDAE